jgi:hypothetical protein
VLLAIRIAEREELIAEHRVRAALGDEVCAHLRLC